MTIVSNSKKNSFEAVSHAGVAVFNEGGHRHSAFLYKTDDTSATLLHLGFHHQLLNNSPSVKYFWADVGELEKEDRRVLANYLSEIALRKPMIPYGLNSEGIEFNEKGELLPNTLGRGVTCATFMLCVLKGIGHVVVDEKGWPVGRPGDNEFKDFVINQLVFHEFTEHAAAVQKDDQCARFRPEEVVGAIATMGWTHGFAKAEALGLQILSDLLDEQ